MKHVKNMASFHKNTPLLFTIIFLSTLLLSSQTNINYLTTIFFSNISATISSDTVEIYEDGIANVTFEGFGGEAPYTFIYELNGIKDSLKSDNLNSKTISLPSSFSGSFTYELIKVIDREGKSKDITDEEEIIKINAPPTADFSFTNNNACSGEIVQFTDSSSGEGNLTYNWSFGDETTISTEKNPTHTYEALGCGIENFDIELTITDENGYSNSTTKTISVAKKPDIEFSDADFGSFNNCGNTSESDPSYTINLINSSNSSCIVAGSYFVDWGDGTTTPSAVFPLSHKYLDAGIFKMKISAKGDNGCSNEVQYEVKNGVYPSGGFESPGNTSNLCIPTGDINFGITNWGLNSSDTEYIVNFGDGIRKTYTQTELEETSYYNLTDPANSSKFLTPHTYKKGSCSNRNGQFVASLSVKNSCGATRFTISNIIVLNPSIPEFDASVENCLNTAILFTNNSTIGDNPDCEKKANFKWDFGDGTTIEDYNTPSAENQTHTYTAPGNYTVSLSVTSKCGVDIYTKEICVEPEITPSFTLDNNDGCIPFAVKATNTTDENGLCSPPSYEWTIAYNSDNCGTSSDWSFTNGTSETSENPSFLFKNPGKYTISRKSTTACGSTTSQEIINVKKPPTVAIDAIPNLCGTAGSISPTASIENCTANTSGISYNWTFVGGIPATATTLIPGEIEYENPGTYEATLEVTNECGVSTTATQTFEVIEKPVILDSDTSQEICSNETTAVINLTSNFTNATFQWTATADTGLSGFIQSGTSNSIPSQTIVNSESTSKVLKYLVTPSLNDCIGVPKEYTITVDAAPVFTKQPIPSEVCENGIATLLEVDSKNGKGTATYKWFSNTTDSNTGGTEIIGENSNSYQPPTAALGTTFYYAEILFSSGKCSKIVSNTAAVSVVNQIQLTSIATEQIICQGGVINPLEVSYSGATGTPTYKWFSNTTNSNSGGTEIIGAENASFTPDSFSNSGNFYYYAVVSVDGSACTYSITSDVYRIEVLSDLIVDRQPTPIQELCLGSLPTDLKVEVAGGSSSPYAYQWFVNDMNSTTGGRPLENEKNDTYSPTSDTGTFYYYVTISQIESGCSITSDVSLVKINPVPEAKMIGSDTVDECLNKPSSPLAVEYTDGIGTPTYEWFSNTLDSNSGGSLIPDQTSKYYTPPTTALGTTYYYAEVSFSSGGCSKIVSNTAAVSVNQIPIINSDSINVYNKIPFTYNPASISGNTVPDGTQYTWSLLTIDPLDSVLGASEETIPQDEIGQTLEITETDSAVVRYLISPVTSSCIGNLFILEVTVNSKISPNAIVTDITCFESNDGAISTTIVGGAGAPYSINWIGPNGFSSNDATITNLEAGEYTLEIKDKEGGSISEKFNINEPALLSIATDLEKNISCFEGNDGTIEVTISGGTSPYSYTWSTTDGSGIVQNTLNQNSLTAGNYTLEIIDKNNCSTSTNFVLNEPDWLKIETISKQNISCFGEATGNIAIDVIGGTKTEISPGVFDYLYSWTGPNSFTSTSKNIENLNVGTYEVTVIDKLGCTLKRTIIIDQPSSKVAIDVTKSDVSCYGETDGSIDIAISGGVTPYQISWSNLANGSSLKNLSAGTYIATVTDGNNCTEQVTVSIEQPIFFINPTVSPISCNGENDGAIDLNLSGGISPISVFWNDDASAGLQRNNLAPGTYSVTITDSDTNQCPIQQTFSLTNPLALAVFETISDATDCDIVNSGRIDLDVFGGTPPYSFLWNTNEITEDLENIPAGEYSVNITDANGCSITKEYTIIRPIVPIHIEIEETLITDCDLNTVNLQTKANVTGGFLPYTYNWSAGIPSASDNSIMTSNQSGSYEITVTDAKGCMATKSFVLEVPSIGIPDFEYSAFGLTNYNFFSVEDPITFTNLSSGNYISVSWNFGDGSLPTNEENPIHTFNQAGSFNVILTVNYTADCISIFEKTIEVTKGYYLVHPTAFTPNNDGYNETIKPYYRGFSNIEMTIYNTWGTVVYKEEGVDLIGWNGFIDGKPAENGNYVMHVSGITFFKKQITKSSPITLLK